MDGVGLRIAGYDLHQVIGELRRGAVRSWFGKVPPGLGLDTAEDVGRAAPFVLRIAPGNPSRPHRPRRAVNGGASRPALGWTPQKTLAVPRRSYSESRRAIRPGRIGRGGRTSACSTTGFSSTQTTGSLSDSGFSYILSTSSIRAMYSSFSAAMHHIFFPPRLQFVALEQDADRLPAHLRRQFPLDRLGSDQPHTPPRNALGRRTAHHGDDSLALAYVQRSLFPWPGLFVQCRFQPLLLITLGNCSHRFRRHTHIGRHLRRLLTNVELAQNRSTPQNTRRFPPLGQHPSKLPPILPSQLDMHPIPCHAQRAGRIAKGPERDLGCRHYSPVSAGVLFSASFFFLADVTPTN